MKMTAPGLRLERINLWPGQKRLIEDVVRPELFVVAGMGYGKSTFGARWHFSRVLLNSKSRVSIVVGPDYKLLEQVCFDTYIGFLESLGLLEGVHFRANKSKLYIDHLWGVRHRIMFLSAEKPRKIMAYNASHCWWDESARSDEKNGPEVYKNLVARVRCPDAACRQKLFTFTPEGENFIHHIAGPDALAEQGRFLESTRRLVLQGSSFDNPRLPDDFFHSLIEAYGWDSALFESYVLGKFVSLSKDRFYYLFKERENVGEFKLHPGIKQFALTWDSNVGQMTWAVLQQQIIDDQMSWCCVKENGSNGRNIEHACEQFVDAFPPENYNEYSIKVLGDASLWARSPHSYTTGYELIERFLKPKYPRLTVAAPRGNPFVEERSRNTNRLLAKKRLLIDKSCKQVLRSVKSAESDGKGGIKKPKGDTVTHAMEAVDMGLMVLEPPPLRPTATGINF